MANTRFRRCAQRIARCRSVAVAGGPGPCRAASIGRGPRRRPARGQNAAAPKTNAVSARAALSGYRPRVCECWPHGRSRQTSHRSRDSAESEDGLFEVCRPLDSIETVRSRRRETSISHRGVSSVDPHAAPTHGQLSLRDSAAAKRNGAGRIIAFPPRCHCLPAPLHSPRQVSELESHARVIEPAIDAERAAAARIDLSVFQTVRHEVDRIAFGRLDLVRVLVEDVGSTD